ncbi:MAG: hypothetical protein HKN11_14455 [Rhizobiales bacterium]|nr:hypothetical protein [Hyphomicrobiales bacterium]
MTQFVRTGNGPGLPAYLASSAAGSAAAAYLAYQSRLTLFAEANLAYSCGLGLALFAVLAGAGTAVSALRSRQSSGSEDAQAALRLQNDRIQAALDNMGEGLCMFDGQKRLIVWNDKYARWYQLPEDLLQAGTSHEAIIGHRVTQGILDGETDTSAAQSKVAALDQLPQGASSSRTDQLRDGRYIRVTRQPLEDGGWVATHTDVTAEVTTGKALDDLNGEINSVVQAAAKGDFSRRVDPGQASGVMLSLSEGMNRLLETVECGLADTVDVVSAMAHGDLSKRIEGDYHGSFAILKDGTNRMGDEMHNVAGQIALVSSAVEGATAEIGAGVADLSARTEHQAASLEETTASMEELSVTVRQNADNAQEANQVAVAARELADSSGGIVGDAVAAMDRIEGSSREISEIVGLIQEIAFQTNLLALNAAVEAARAGDAGKGFAVVASEVRALAQRAGQASRDIKDLISSSDEQVNQGVELVNKTGGVLAEIVGSVKKVADFVAEIATASQEQSAGIDQVSQAINAMEEMTQQNGALVEETTAALNSAQSQVSALRQVVAFFKIVGEADEPANADAQHAASTANPAEPAAPRRDQQAVPAIR